jgi:hypothetical protein
VPLSEIILAARTLPEVSHNQVSVSIVCNRQNYCLLASTDEEKTLYGLCSTKGQAMQLLAGIMTTSCHHAFSSTDACRFCHRGGLCCR